MEPPVLSLCENMVMQIDANYVVLYMQISHATTLCLLCLGVRQTLLFVDAHVYQFMFGSVVFVLKQLPPQGYKCNQYSISPKKLKSLMYSLHDSLLGVRNTPTES